MTLTKNRSNLLSLTHFVLVLDSELNSTQLPVMQDLVVCCPAYFFFFKFWQNLSFNNISRYLHDCVFLMRRKKIRLHNLEHWTMKPVVLCQSRTCRSNERIFWVNEVNGITSWTDSFLSQFSWAQPRACRPGVVLPHAACRWGLTRLHTESCEDVIHVRAVIRSCSSTPKKGLSTPKTWSKKLCISKICVCLWQG